MTLNGEPWNQLTLFAEATPANRSAPPGKETERTTNGTFGQNSQTLLGFYDPDTHSWKTSQATFLLDSEQSLQTWPRAGMTRNGTAYQLPPSAHRTSATEFSLSLHGKMWPTPQAHLSREGGYPAEGRRNTPGLTFQALDGQPGRLNPEWVEWLMGFPTGWTDLED